MANEVTITVVGRDRTGGLFSGVSRRADQAFGAVRQSVRTQMAGAANDAEEGGRAIGDRLVSGTRRAVADRSGQLTADLTGMMPAAGEEAGAGFGDGVVRGAESRLRDGRGQVLGAVVPSGEAEQEGRNVGTRLTSGLTGAITSGAPQVKTAFAETYREAESDADRAGRAIGTRVKDGFATAYREAETEAEQAGRTIGTRLKDAFATAYRGAEVDADRAGRNIGTRLTSGIHSAVTVGSGQMRGLFDGQWASLDDDADRRGRSMGSRLMAGFKGAVSSAAHSVGDGLKDALGTVGSAAGPVLIAALLAVAVPAALAAGSLIGTSLVLGFGAGLAGLGVAMLLHTEKINKEWSEAEQKRVAESNKQAEKIKEQFVELQREIVNGFKEIAQPLVGVLDTVRSTIRDVGSEFKPVFQEAFADAKVPLQQFVRDFGAAFKELAPSINPVMESFSGLLGRIGPLLKPLFADISSAFIGLADAVNRNQTVVSSLFTQMLQLIPMAIDAVAWLINTYGELLGFVNRTQAAIRTTFLGATQSVATFGEKFLGVLRNLAQALSNVPGMEQISQKLVAGIDNALGKLQVYKTEAAEASKAIKLEADIIDLTQKIDLARSQLQDPELSKERRAKLNADIAELMEKKNQAIVALGDPKLVKEYMSSLNTRIDTLQERLKTARKELADPNLTKERKSKLNADISQLKSQIAQAKAALNSLKDKTVRVTTIYSSVQGQQAALAKASKYAHGGIIGAAAAGGPRSNMTLVGEQGPELVRLPFGSSVIPAGQSQAMMQQAGSGGGVTVNLYVQGSIRSDRDLIALIRDEFINGGFRGAVTA